MFKHWVIGDVHGCVLTLRKLVEEKIIPTTQDVICFTGDYIDRGPSSKQVIDYLIELEQQGMQLQLIQGNHEEMFLNCYQWEKTNTSKSFFSKKNPYFNEWNQNGGKEALESFGVADVASVPEQYIEWAKKTMNYVESEKHLIVHAGFNFKKENIFEDVNSMKWIREFEVDFNKTKGRSVIHGHTPVHREVIENCIRYPELGFIDLDNGCVYKNKSGMGHLAAYEIFSQELHFEKNID